MIDQFSIFHRGGGVLWERTLTSMTVSPVDSLIQTVLLEERAASTSFRHDKYVLKWTFANELELVFVAAYLNVANLMYVDQLLDRVKHAFVALIKPHWDDARKAHKLPAVKFDARFDRIVAQLEMNSVAARKGPRSFEEANKATPAAATNGSKTSSKKQPAGGETDGDTGEDEGGAARGDEEGNVRDGGAGDKGGSSSSSTVSSGSESAVSGGSTGGFNADKLRAMQHAMAVRGQRPMRAGGPHSKKKSKDVKDAASKEGAEEDGKKKRVKQATKWSLEHTTAAPRPSHPSTAHHIARHSSPQNCCSITNCDPCCLAVLTKMCL